MDAALSSLEVRSKELGAAASAAAAADPEQARLLRDLQAELAQLKATAASSSDPRMTFSTPEFRQAAQQFAAGFRENFGRAREYAMVKDHPWSRPALRKVVMGKEEEGEGGGTEDEKDKAGR
jgi:DNA-binding GntR family transcriptional regulator